MTVELEVPYHPQESPMSCWWACIRMVLAYNGHTYRYPWELNAHFTTGRHVATGYYDRYYQPRTGALPLTRSDGPPRDPFWGKCRPEAYEPPYVWIDPSHWFRWGVRTDDRHLRALASLTRMSMLPHGLMSVDAASLEATLRERGPLIAFKTVTLRRLDAIGQVTSSDRLGHHAVVLIGALPDSDQLVLHDPQRADGSFLYQPASEVRRWFTSSDLRRVMYYRWHRSGRSRS